MSLFKKILIISCISIQFVESKVQDELIFMEKAPKKLSEYGFFKNMSAQIPAEGVLPYDLISPLFSDYADKLRFIYIPKSKAAKYRSNKVFDFPEGTALIKTFAYLNEHENSAIPAQLLETRLLLKRNGEWVNVSYVWDSNQDEAYLTVAGKTISTKFINNNGDYVDVRYRVPNINQCKECHQIGKTITPIGPKLRNLDKEYVYDDGVFNQLAKWHDQGWIDNKFDEVAMVDWTDKSKTVDQRARSYLDINCAHCHIEGGSADTSGLYLDYIEKREINLGIYKKPIATGRGSNNLKYSIVPGNPEESILLYRMKSLDPGVMMPESGRALEHTEAIELIGKWIKNL